MDREVLKRVFFFFFRDFWTPELNRLRKQLTVLSPILNPGRRFLEGRLHFTISSSRPF